jgi:hypothetical protein
VKATLAAINQMRADDVIGKYAIGGVPRYISSHPLRLISISWPYCRHRGEGAAKPHSDLRLLKSAWRHRTGRTVEDVATWLMSAEHLVAIALQTGRSKDYLRIVQFIEPGRARPDKTGNSSRTARSNRKVEQFERRYLGGTHE